MALDMIEVGETSGALGPMLTSIAEFYEEEVDLRLGAMVSVIEPVILIFMGILVAFILISLYLPIFSFSVTGTVGPMATTDHTNIADGAWRRGRRATRARTRRKAGGAVSLQLYGSARAAHRSGIVSNDSRGLDVPLQLRAAGSTE